MIKKVLLFSLFFLFLIYVPPIYSNTLLSATFYQGGVNSPWSIGMDYDLGFGKLFSFNIQFTGGINSQVNRASTFGDVFFGELQIGPRLYMNKFDKWEGLYLTPVARVGIYNVPIRTQDNPLTETSRIIIDRSSMFLYGFGIYVGYRWTRNFVSDMSNLPFYLILEPYLGWTVDFLIALNPPESLIQNRNAINRFTVGLTFKIGFYTHKKSKATLEAEAKEKADKEKKDKESIEQKSNSTNQNN